MSTKENKPEIVNCQICKEPINEIEDTFCDLRGYFKNSSKGGAFLSFKEIDSYFQDTKSLLNKNISY